MHTLGLHILVIEDNPGDYFLLEEQIKLTPIQTFKIMQAENLRQACTWLGQLRFDVILMDLSLPDSSGLDTFREILPLAQRTPIVVLSGMADFELALESVRLGAQDYLVKGDFDEKLLYKVISHSLERKRQLDQLEHSESKYKHLFESNPQPMWVYHQQTMAILAVNHAAVAHYGYSSREFLEMKVGELMPPAERARWEAWDVRSKPEYMKAGLWEHLTKDGRLIHANVLWHRMHFEDQPACLVLAQDMSATVQTEQEKNMLIQELTHKNNHLEQFAYIVSHNLRAPVANLLGLCQISIDDQLGEIEKLMGMIHHSAQRLDDVILQLNQTLNIQKGMLHQAFVSIELPKLLDDILEAYRPQIQEAGAVCRLDLQAIECAGIYSYVYSILENLISNALKYRSPERPLELDIHSEAVGDRILISVADNGLGLPERFLETYAFGMYKRFHSHVEGKGLGLFMCKNQVEALGGKITVESTVGKGTTFFINLPRQPHIGATAAHAQETAG